MTIAELLRRIRKQLSPLLGELAGPDAELILQHFLHQSRTELYVSSTNELDHDTVAKIEAVVSRRITGEPLQYILGSTFFYDRDFLVTPKVLIPRPDTETLIETVLSHETENQLRFADIGTGSGIIATTLKNQRRSWSAFAADISLEALFVAQKNAGGTVQLICTNMLSAFKPGELFEFIVSNPPYISADEMAKLDKSVSDHEPHTALYGGLDGLEYYRTLASEAPKVLIPNGRIYLEIGYDQGKSVPDILISNGWEDIEVIKDLGGRSRVVKAGLKCNRT